MNGTSLGVFTANPGDLSWAEFESLGRCTIHDRTPADQTIERAQDAEVVITNKAVLSRAVIESLPKLRYIGVIATGYNVVDIAAARERGIIVANVPGYGSPSVAQAVFALLLELTNHTGQQTQDVSKGRWAACPDFCFWDKPIIELQGLTLGLVGLGDIGASVARIALAFGMKVIATRRTWAVPPPEGITPAPLDKVLRESDVISLHCPLTDETKHLINADSLAQMKPTALLINTARGPLIDEVVQPACQAVAEELRKQGLPATVESGADGRVRLAVAHGSETDFSYEVRPRAFAQPSFALRDTGDDGNEERKYFRAEVHLREGGQDYDVMGWVREAVIDDILDQYEKHMHYLHLVR